MLVNSQNLVSSLLLSVHSHLAKRTVKSTPHLRERRFLTAILTADDVEVLSRLLNEYVDNIICVLRNIVTMECSSEIVVRMCI